MVNKKKKIVGMFQANFRPARVTEIDDFNGDAS